MINWSPKNFVLDIQEVIYANSGILNPQRHLTLRMLRTQGLRSLKMNFKNFPDIYLF